MAASAGISLTTGRVLFLKASMCRQTPAEHAAQDRARVAKKNPCVSMQNTAPADLRGDKGAIAKLKLNRPNEE
jgi:hypothetical protein